MFTCSYVYVYCMCIYKILFGPRLIALSSPYSQIVRKQCPNNYAATEDKKLRYDIDLIHAITEEEAKKNMKFFQVSRRHCIVHCLLSFYPFCFFVFFQVFRGHCIVYCLIPITILLFLWTLPLSWFSCRANCIF